MSVEPPRLLAARSEHGYTDRQAEALVAEPEAVPADYQQALVQRAARSATEHEKYERDRAREQLQLAIRWLDRLAPALNAAREQRAARNALVRLDRRLAIH